MRCLRCGAENRPGRRFCSECGGSLAVACPSCRFLNDPGEKFCGGCGAATSLRTDGAASSFGAPDSYTPKHLAEKILTSRGALEGERKQVTVLFADLRGSMELLADRDPEEARALLDPVLQRMMEAVHRYEGTVNQVLGDGIMALFGAPIAHEDHAVRACYAALRMQQSVATLAAELRASKGVDVQVRVGLNSGEVVVRSIASDLQVDYSAVGTTTHLAARMEQLARPGTTLLASATLRHVEGWVDVAPLGLMPVKGLAEPVEVYELLRAGRARSRLAASAVRGLTRFVGRDAEMSLLTDALERAHVGHGQIAAIVGEPGVGKSRLVWELTHSHRMHGWLVLEAGSVSYGKASAYLPLADLLRGYFAIESGDDQRRVREKVTGKVLILDRTLEPALPALLALLDVTVDDPAWTGLEPRVRRQRTLEAARALLMSECRVQPVLVVFEDLHWIDSETQAFLEGFVESLAAARCLLLVNYRPEYEHGWGRKTYYTQVRLDPLPAASAEELLDALLGRDPALAPVRERLIARTEGNPFFLEESVRTLLEAGALAGEPGARRLVRHAHAVEIPVTVQAVIAARIDRLPVKDKRLLQAAAVVGKDVPVAFLTRIADGTDDVPQGLARLQSAEFLYEIRLFPEPEYTFKHALTHEVAYGTLLRGVRQDLHGRLARALEKAFPDLVETQPELLAHHLTEGGLADEAVTWWERAATRALDRSAHREAIRSLTRALEVLATLPETPQRVEREFDLNRALDPPLIATTGYGSVDMERIARRAGELAGMLEDPGRRIRAAGLQWSFHVMRGPLPTALALARQVYEFAHALPSSHPARVTSLVAVNMQHSQTVPRMGDFAAALEYAEQGLALYDATKHSPALIRNVQDLGVTLMSDAAGALWALGYPDRSLAYTKQALAHARRLGHPYTLSWALMNAAAAFWRRQDARTVLSLATEAAGLATHHGFAFHAANATVSRGWALSELGDATEGLALLRDGVAERTETGARSGHASSLALYADALAKNGRVDDALRLIFEALEVIEAIGERGAESGVRHLEGELQRRHAACLTGEASVDAERAAERCFRHAITVAREQQAKMLELRATVSLSRLLAGGGDRPEARRHLAEVYGWFTEGFDTADLKAATALLDELDT
jgi:class 3 adenylate cyclase/tetratricopeptide (TPR) repeat protein